VFGSNSIFNFSCLIDSTSLSLFCNLLYKYLSVALKSLSVIVQLVTHFFNISLTSATVLVSSALSICDCHFGVSTVAQTVSFIVGVFQLSAVILFQAILFIQAFFIISTSD
jgi:hypothetical protein